MPNNSTKPNNSNSTNGIAFADKHKDFFSKNNPAQQTSNAPTSQPTQYLNPNNFEQILGKNATPFPQTKPNPAPAQNPNINQNTPKTPVSSPQESVQQTNPRPNPNPAPVLEQVRSANIPPMQTKDFHEKRLLDQKTINATKGFETLKLIVYVVPIIGIFVLVLKSVSNRDVMWHVRQSLVGQGIWFVALIVLRLINMPIISDIGVTLWNIACYGLLLIAGVQAYNNQKYNIPIVYDIGKDFIDGKD